MMKLVFYVYVLVTVVLLGSPIVLAQDENLEDSILTALRLVTDMSYATQGYVSRLSAINMPAEGPVSEKRHAPLLCTHQLTQEVVQALDDIRDTFVMEVPILTNVCARASSHHSQLLIGRRTAGDVGTLRGRTGGGHPGSLHSFRGRSSVRSFMDIYVGMRFPRVN